MALIEVRDVTKVYAEDTVATSALRGVTLDIEAGSFVAITGPSGSGKSTLLHILGLLDRPTSGTYRFDGRDARSLSERDAATARNANIGFVFQLFHLLPRVSVLQNVMLPLVYSTVPRSERERKARRALEAIGMTYRLTHLPSQLSGGERQRVAIARAIVNDPLVLFADEPTGNLDSASGEMVMGTFETLHARGHTIVLVTHETYTAEHAERVVRIQDGLIAADRPVPNRRAAHDEFHAATS